MVTGYDALLERRHAMFLHMHGANGLMAVLATSLHGKCFTRVPHNARFFAFDDLPRNSTLHGATLKWNLSHFSWYERPQPHQPCLP